MESGNCQDGAFHSIKAVVSQVGILIYIAQHIGTSQSVRRTIALLKQNVIDPLPATVSTHLLSVQ